MVHMGLIFRRQNEVYELHPALTGFLRSAESEYGKNDVKDVWARAFVDVMGTIADDLAPKPLHEQRGAFHIFGASFHYAMAEARRLEMHVYYRAILQSLAAYAQNTLNFSEAMHLFQQLATAHKETGTPEGEAGAYHQLGRIAEEQRDFQTAEKWYRKSLEIFEKQGNEHGAAMTCGQMGILFRLQENYESSGRWLIRSILGFINTGDDSNTQQSVANFVTTYKAAPASMYDKLKSMWTQAGLGDFSAVINSEEAINPAS